VHWGYFDVLAGTDDFVPQEEESVNSQSSEIWTAGVAENGNAQVEGEELCSDSDFCSELDIEIGCNFGEVGENGVGVGTVVEKAAEIAFVEIAVHSASAGMISKGM